jgi:hypothetical protein
VTILAIAVLAIAGALLVIRSEAIPEYTNPDLAEHLRAMVYPTDPSDQARFEDEWHRGMESVRTSKWLVHDTGRGLLALSASLLVAMAAFGLWDLRRLRFARTPASSIGFLSAGGIIWLAQIPAVIMDLHDYFDRKYFPYWGDIIAIPIYGTTILVLATLPVLYALGWLVLRGTVLPARLWVWDAARPVRSTVWTVVFAVPMLVVLHQLLTVVTQGPYLMVPLGLVGFYLLLSARAAIVTKPLRAARA